jgi:hypothetical protein
VSCHRDADFDSGSRTSRRRDTETELRTMRYAGGYRNGQRSAMARIAGALAKAAAVTPDLASTTASAACRTHGHFQWNRGTGAGLMSRQVNLRAKTIQRAVRFDKRVTHPLDFVADRRKINRDFVCKRSLELPVGTRRPLDCDPRVLHAPVMLHGLARSVGVPIELVNPRNLLSFGYDG